MYGSCLNGVILPSEPVRRTRPDRAVFVAGQAHRLGQRDRQGIRFNIGRVKFLTGGEQKRVSSRLCNLYARLSTQVLAAGVRLITRLPCSLGVVKQFDNSQRASLLRAPVFMRYDCRAAGGEEKLPLEREPINARARNLRLSPTLQLEDAFAPQSWPNDNAADADLGSMEPVLLPDDLLFAHGKSGQGYLLRADRLGGVGGQIQTISLCSAGAYGGAAVSGQFAFIPCADGLREIQVTPGATLVAGTRHGR